MLPLQPLLLLKQLNAEQQGKKAAIIFSELKQIDTKAVCILQDIISIAQIPSTIVIIYLFSPLTNASFLFL